MEAGLTKVAVPNDKYRQNLPGQFQLLKLSSQTCPAKLTNLESHSQGHTVPAP